MATILDGVMDKKVAAQHRLASIETLDLVLSTARRMARNAPSLLGLAQSLRLDAREAIEGYGAQLTRIAPPSSRLPDQLLEAPALSSQLAAFVQAGLLFFGAEKAFEELPLGDRRAMGGSGSVTRTLRIGDRLLLETARLVVQYADGTDEGDRDALRKRHNLVRVLSLDFLPRGEICAILGGHRALDVAQRLLEEPAIAFAAPDFVENVGRRQLNDPDLHNQWHLHNLAYPGADIAAPAAWPLSTGKGIRIAVIDNGFDTSHADLQFGNLDTFCGCRP